MDTDPNERVEAVWVYDSETSERVLIDCLTNKEIMRIPVKKDGD